MLGLFQDLPARAIAAGEITMSSTDVVAVDDIDFELVLTEMADPGWVNCSSRPTNPKGFLMPLKKGGRVSAEIGVLDKVVAISTAIHAREAIRSLSGRSTKAKACRRGTRSTIPASSCRTATSRRMTIGSSITREYDEWFDRRFEHPEAAGRRSRLGDFIELFDKVRKQGFQRLSSARAGSARTRTP
jgi:hypothetical protein